MNEAAQQQYSASDKCASGLAGNLCTACTLDRDASLFGRIQMQAEQAERESARATDLRELEYLLKENPVTARILDLLGKVRGL